MNKILSLSLTVLIITLLEVCSSRYLIISQDELKEYPCNEADSGVNVRIRNNGSVAFSKANLKIGKKIISFPGLVAGEISCYKNAPFVYPYNSLDLLFSKQQGYFMTLITLAADQIPDVPLKHGYVTFDVKISKAKEGLDADIVMVVDEKQ